MPFIKFRHITVNISTVATSVKLFWRMVVKQLTTGSESFRAWDASNNGNHGELFSGISLDFNGTSTQVTVGDIGDQVKTICFWVKPTTNTEKFMDLDGGSTVIESVSGVLTMTGFTSPAPYVNGINDNQITTGVWNFICVVTGTAVDASNLILGESGSTFLDGSLCGLKIYTDAMTATTVASQYEFPERRVPVGMSGSAMLLWLPLSEGDLSQSYVYDHSGNGFHSLVANGAFAFGQAGILPQIAFTQLSRLLIGNATSFVSVANNATLQNTTTVTVALWFIPFDTTGANALYFHNPISTGLAIFYQSGNLRIRGGGGTTLVNSDFNSVGELYHLLITVESGTDVTIYKNGTEVATGTVDALATPTGTLNLGSFDDQVSGWPHDALILSAAEWNSVLEITDIDSLASGTNPTAIKISDQAGIWENTGTKTWPDLSSNSNDGTVTGTAAVINILEGRTDQKSPFGFSLTDFLGNVAKLYGQEYIKISSNSGLEIDTDFTVMCWIKHNTKDTTQMVATKGSTFEIEINSDNTISFTIYSGAVANTVTTDTTLVEFNWVHFAATFDGSTIKVYLDGGLSKTGSLTGTIDTSSSDVYGGAEAGPTNHFYGWFDDFKMTCSLWTATEILDEYVATEPDHSNDEFTGGLFIGDPDADEIIGDPGSGDGIGSS